MYKCITFGLLIALTSATLKGENEIVSDNLNCYQYEDDIFSCVAIKIISSLNRATRFNDLKITDGITFIKDTPNELNERFFKPETEMLNELSRDLPDRTLQLATMLLESATSFFKSHKLKFNISSSSMSRAFVQGRAKLKKMIFPLIAATGIKMFTLVPILFGSLVLFMVKALFMGKIAILVAAILAFQRLFASSSNSIGGSFGNIGSNLFNKHPQSSWHDNNQGWSGTSTNQGQGYYRSFNNKIDADYLAYVSQVPNSNEANK